jgi:2-hydroxychromene-2-carboxylate isomerase
MWRDIERRAARHGIPYARPSTYPVDMLPTARVGCVAAAEGWCQAFTEKVFELHWTRDVPIGSAQNMRGALQSLGRSPDVVLAQAQTQPVKDRLRLQTSRAKALGVFGAPSFTVGSELFWGDDRLEEALQWALEH